VAARGAAGPFYRRRKAVRPEIFFELGKLRWLNNGGGGENIPPLTPSGEAATGIHGGAVNAALWDGIGRAEVVAGELVGAVTCSGGDAWR
jgi:hypothetical protein